MPTRSIRRRVSRRRWGAMPPDCRTPILPGQLRGFAIHYSGALRDRRADHSECAGVVRSFQAFHMGPGGLGVPEGGCDVAYSHVICPHGATFVGRGFWHRTGANGDTEPNRLYLAVCLLGGDRPGRRDVTPEARQSLIVYRRRLLTLHPLARQVRFHSSFVGTSCPGDELRALGRQLWPNAVRERRG